MMFNKNLIQQARFISIVLFSISLTQKCYCTESSCAYSAGTFLVGWVALYMGGPMLTWLANPMLLIAWLTAKRMPYASLIFSLMAAIISLFFLFFKEIYNYDDNGIHSAITYYKAGYWLWVASCWCILISNIVLFCKANKFAVTPAIGLVLFIGMTMIFIGLRTVKQDFIGYKFTGNKDTLSNDYRIAQCKQALYATKNYIHKTDTFTANYIIRQYHKYGSPLKKQQLNGSAYPKIDSIIKYSSIVFDTTAFVHK